MWTRVLVASVLLTAGCTATTHAEAKPALATARPVVETIAATGSVTALGDGKTHSPAAARKLADAALDLLTFPAGSTRLATKPEHGATSVGIETVITSQVTRDRWWSVPGTVADAAAWLTANAPTGLTVTQPQPGYLSWAGLPWFPMNGYLAQDGDHVDVSVSTQVIWIPLKTPIETIPTSVTSAALDFDGDANAFGLDARRVLTGTALSRLRDSLNGYQPRSIGPEECPPGYGGLATVTLHYAGHDVVMSTGGWNCRTLIVTSDGKPQPVLECCAPGTSSVDDILAPLLPANHPLRQQRSLLASVRSVKETLAQDNQLLASLPLPPTAVRDKPPHGQPVDFRETNQHLVEATRWFTFRQDRATTVGWLSAHLPLGFSVAHVSVDYYGSTVMVEQPVGVYPSPVDLVLTLSGKGSTTKAQVTARKFYLPTRTAAETIPLTSRTAQLSVQHGQAPTRRVQASGADLTRLIRLLNGRPAQWFGTACTKTGPITKLGALFHTGRHTVNFYWYGDSCAMIVVVDGKTAPYLAGPPTALLEQIVREAKP